MQPDSSFVALLERLRAGDAAAAQRIYDVFIRRLIGLASKKLDQRVLQKDGAEDVAASALKSFFLRDQQKPFADLSSWDSLWRLLATITMRKCGHRVEYYLAAKRDVQREATPNPTDESVPAFEGIARDPTPDEVATFEDTLRHLLQGLDDRERQIVQLVLEGHTIREISEQVHRSEHLIRTLLKKVRTRWERLYP
ncbi:MAG: ECF-type sigma factor [Gemmataceae bacterium]